MLPSVYSVALWEFSSLMCNHSPQEEQELFWNKTQQENYKYDSTVLWETCRRAQEKGKYTFQEVSGN